jgi:Icc-related predicted phosphoesterase
MKICLISDTHNKHRELKIPENIDMIIFAGDISFRGEISIISDFANWMKDLPIQHKIVIAGNHDRSFEDNRHDIVVKLLHEAGITYLQDNSITIDGLNIYGSPWQPAFCNWSFNAERGKEIAAIWSKIPDSTHILVTHGPPKGVLDLVENDYGGFDHIGCEDLMNRIDQLKELKLSTFGHLHLQGAQKAILNGIIFVNAAMCDEQYKITREPVIVDISTITN